MAFTVPEAIRSLPIADVVEKVLSALENSNVLLSAEPGAGKSTGLPLALIQLASPSNRIVMLEPRRLAAIGVAQRLAAQLNEPLGQRVGLRMRGQTSVSASTVLEVVTEGVLTRLLQSDPTLEGIGWVIFDEFHERSLHADLGLALCLDVQQSIRDNLRLLLMSATLNMEGIQTALGNANSGKAAQVNCAGRQYPVHVHWLGSSNEPMPVQVTAAVRQALSDASGDVLVFLPGVAEIERTAALLEPQVRKKNAKVHRLHGRADSKQQEAATAPAKENQRRIILSTSIAETSITIEGVRVVIDAGFERRSRVNQQTGAQQLETVSASQASATQRTGRAGRTSAGVCFRLWSEHDHARRSRSWQPEILRAELSSVLVEIGLWGVSDINSLPWLDPPPAASFARAEQLLCKLGLWQAGRLTELGKRAADLPVHPRLARMLLWSAEHGSVATACKLAVLLDEGSQRNRETDMETLLQFKLSGFLQRRASQLEKALDQYVDNGHAGDHHSSPSVGVLLAQAFPDWIAQRRSGTDARFALACGAGAFLTADSALANQEWICVANMGGVNKEARIFLAAALDIDELEACSVGQVSQIRHLAWDDQQQRVIAEQRKCIGSLVIAGKPITDISDEETAQALLQGIRKRGLSCLPWTDEARQFQARVQQMQSLTLPASLADWPVLDDSALLNDLEEWLLVWLNGLRSIKALTQLNVLSILQARLDYQQQLALDDWLPVRYTVPSGSKIKLRYGLNEPPVLAVKLQEMFGCQANPAIAQGQLTLKVELLSPARRPVQVTTDLANFWSNSYPDVKKDLAGRYPKHDWPEDPLQATPTAYAKPRKKKR